MVIALVLRLKSHDSILLFSRVFWWPTGCVEETAARCSLALAQGKAEERRLGIHKCREAEGGGQEKVSLCTVRLLRRRSRGFHWGVCDLGKQWWGGCCAEFVPARHSVVLSKVEDLLLSTPSLQLLHYCVNSSLAFCRETSARWEPDGSGTCAGSGLQQLLRALQCTDCTVSSSLLSHSSVPVPIKTNFFLLHKQLFSGILSDRASRAGKVILPLVLSLERICDTRARDYSGHYNRPALQETYLAHTSGGELRARCEHNGIS